MLRTTVLEGLEADSSFGPPVRCGRLELDELRSASEVFLTNAVQRLIGVVALTGPGLHRELPGARGPVLREVALRMERAVERERETAVTLCGSPRSPRPTVHR